MMAVLTQMKQDLSRVEQQLKYMEGEEEIYDLFLTDRTLTEDDNIKKLLRGPFLVTTGFNILNLQPKVLELLKERSTLQTKYSSILDEIEATYTVSQRAMSRSEDIYYSRGIIV